MRSLGVDSISVRCADAVRGMLRLNTFTRHTLVLASGTAIGQLLTVASMPILTRFYSPEDMGLLGVFVAFVNTAGVAVALRYDMAIPSAPDDQEANALLVLCIALSIPMSVLGAGALTWMIRTDVLSYGQLPQWSMFLAFIALAAAGVSTALRYWLLRNRRFSDISYVSILQGAARGIIPILLKAAQIGWVGLLLGDVAGRTFGVARMWRVAAGSLRSASAPTNRWRIEKAAKRFWKFPVVSLPSSLLDVMAQSVPVVLIAHLYGTADAGLFMLVQRVLWLPTSFVAISVADVFHGRIAERMRTDVGSMRSLFVSMLRSMSVVGIVLLLPVAVVGPVVFETVFGRAWSAGGPLILIIAPWAFMMVVVSPASRLIIVAPGMERKLIYDAFSLLSSMIPLYIASGMEMSLVHAILLLSMAHVLSYIVYLYLLFRALPQLPFHPTPLGADAKRATGI